MILKKKGRRSKKSLTSNTDGTGLILLKIRNLPEVLPVLKSYGKKEIL